MKRKWFWVLGVTACVLPFLFLLFLSGEHFTLQYPSPNGEYFLEQRCYEVGPGYYGKTYLAQGSRRWYVDNYGPGHAGWLSDTEFYVGSYPYGDYTTFSVSDFAS